MQMMLTNEIEMVRYCVHCENHVTQRVVYQQESIGDFGIDDEGELMPLYRYMNFVAVCATCDGLSIRVGEVSTEHPLDDGDNRRSFWESKLAWPKKLNFDASFIPESIAEIYQEALKIKNLAPNAFVVQIRRALEAICLDQGIINKGTLHESLKKLTGLGRLPPLLSEVTNVIKMIGNAGAHVGKLPISYVHVSAIDDFFRVVLEYLYIAPSKLNKFKEEVDKFKS